MKSIVEEEDVANVVAKQTGIPINRLTEGETQKVLKMEEELKDEHHRPRRCASKQFAEPSAAAEPTSKTRTVRSAPFFSWPYRGW